MVSVSLQRSSDYTVVAVFGTEAVAPTFWGQTKG